MKKLVFDTTSAGTILDSDSVGAFVRSSDGTIITHTTNDTKEGLDVNVINDSIEVTAENLDIRDLTHDSDSVKVGDGTDFLAINEDGSINITDNGGSLTVDAENLDIRDLTAASDSVAAHLADGAGTALTSTLVDDKQALDVNIVEGVNVEVDLSHEDDSVALGDGTNLLTSTTIGDDIGLDVNVINNPATANAAIKSTAGSLTAAGTAQKVVATNLAARKFLFINNTFNRNIFIGGNDVSVSNGFPLSPGAAIELLAGANVDVYFDSTTTGATIRNLELS
jgi:hypothetical protein